MHFHLCRQIVPVARVDDQEAAFPLTVATVATPREACAWVESKVMDFERFFVSAGDRDSGSLVLMIASALAEFRRGGDFVRAWPIYNPRHYLLVAATCHLGAHRSNGPLCAPTGGRPDDPRKEAPIQPT